MTKKKRTKNQIIGLISLTLVIAAATYGFAEAEAIGTIGLMEVGYGVKSEYEVTGISYVLVENSPTDFTAVSFNLDQPAQAVTAGISDAKNGQVFWADSCEFSGYNWVCSFGDSMDVRMANWLYVK